MSVLQSISFVVRERQVSTAQWPLKAIVTFIDGNAGDKISNSYRLQSEIKFPISFHNYPR